MDNRIEELVRGQFEEREGEALTMTQLLTGLGHEFNWEQVRIALKGLGATEEPIRTSAGRPRIGYRLP